MNSINLVISGNLTGFSRFYATPSANDILNDAKFDFDYRNFLTFLNSGDKAYAISFAPSVLAVSLVSRILDSFRRPGVLVVTILLPRKSKVESTLNPQNKNALYQLLNEIYNKFHDKNFINGMLNQNAAVLMQDYYTEILANYVLVSDGLQRNINTTIEVTSPNKRLGYVQTSEDSVPLYLESPCRRNYEGYHHVFFAQNPVQNLIAEEPVEVVYYRVHITNNSQTLPSVTLNDRIPNIRPDEGEVDIEKNFTYQQVLNGDAGRNIVADLRGETIELTYRFGLEEKNIKFVFNEGGKEIPFTAIMPVLEFNGTFINIPSETYTFQGKEIYGSKRIKSRGTEYRVKRESENLDLRRLQDTCIIQVEHCFSINVFFNHPEDKQKRIVFKSNHGSFPFTDVTNHLDAVLPGYPEEYSYTIESLYYEKESGYLATSGTHIQLPQLRPVIINIPPTRQGGNIPMQPTGRQVIGKGYNGGRDARVNEAYAHSKGRQSGGAIQLTGENDSEYQFPKYRDNKFIKVMPYVSGILCIGIAYFLIALFTNWWPFSDDKRSQKDTGYTEVEQLIKIQFKDATKDPLKLSDFKDYGSKIDAFNDLVDVIFQNEEGKPIERYEIAENNDTIQYNYKINIPSQSENIKYSFMLKIKGEDIEIGSDDMYSDDMKGTDGNEYDKTVSLKIKTSELLAYKKAFDLYHDSSKELSQDEINKIRKKAEDLIESESCVELGNRILELIKTAEEKASKKAEEEVRKAEEAKKKVEKKQEQKGNNQSLDGLKDYLPDLIKRWVNNAKSVNTDLDVYKNLKQQQKEVIDKYNKWIVEVYKKKKDKKQQNKIKKEELSKCSNFNQIDTVINKYKGNNN